MKISTTIRFNSPDATDVARKIALSLKPDNLTNMETMIEEDQVSITIRTEKISSMIATVDDLLMNAKISEDIIKEVEEKDDL
ncbi:KEOPS complex subunit Pcc1 [Methanococcoides sp. AM1]|uniref:KEOPS complex subunit Pcc1 n=1 Tax=Methanococcoides sp. AM1 TaxID=1201011 RepID=UPI0010826BA9|nr:KEOPS complex subunit Pcc1 [Methanococcoides sp. AM1]